MGEEDPCNGTQTALIAVLCVALLIMTSQSVILGFIYRRWKTSRGGTRSNRNRRSIMNPVRRHRSDRSNNSNNIRTENTTQEPRPSMPEPRPEPAVEYAAVNRNGNDQTNDASDPIYMNQPSNHVSPPAPKVKITKKQNVARVPPQSLAIDNELYADMGALQAESARRGLTPGSQTVSVDMAIDNDTYFDSSTINQRPGVPKKPKK